jgi:hypothetical protein
MRHLESPQLKTGIERKSFDRYCATVAVFAATLLSMTQTGQACGPSFPADYISNKPATLATIILLIPFELVIIKRCARLNWVDTITNYLLVALFAKIAGVVLTFGYIIGDLKWESINGAIGVNLWYSFVHFCVSSVVLLLGTRAAKTPWRRAVATSALVSTVIPWSYSVLTGLFRIPR